jgi:FAD/FMN-containing dehydrogenase
LARKHGISFLATAGRHGYSTVHGRLQNGLAMDLRQLNSIQLDTEAETVTVGGGVTTGEVLEPLSEAGFDLREYLLTYIVTIVVTFLDPGEGREHMLE